MAGAIGTRSAEILSGLDAQQRELVTTIQGPVLGVAGPGAGKTTAMTRRVAYMIDQGIPPTSILLLTFTRAAASSMLQRARALSPEAAMVNGGTFHHVAGTLLRDACAAFGLAPNFTVLDPSDCHDAVTDCITALPFPGKGNRPRSRTVHNVISYQANTRCDHKTAVMSRAANWSEHADWFKAIRERYVDYKISKSMVDYDDLLLYFAALANDPEYGPQIRQRWPYVMVDEHQDSNPAQMDIILGLGGDNGNVMVIGDPSQSIYGFRGAAPRAMFAIRERWPHVRVIPMETNYRSTAQIVAVVNAIDRQMTERFERTLRSVRSQKGEKPALVACEDDPHQAQEICARILDEKEKGVPLEEQAILVRSTWAARAIEFELLAQRIPYRFVGGLKIDDAAHVKDLLSLARTVDNPKHELAWIRILTLLDGLGQTGARKLLPTLTQASQSDEIPAALDRLQWPRRVDPGPVKRAVKAMLTPGLLSARLTAAVDALEPCFKNRYKEDWQDRHRDIEAVIDIADNHETLTAFLESLTIDYSMDGRQKVEGSVDEDERPLTLSTIHSAKGLEWTSVHIPSFNAGHLPHFAAFNSGEGMDEELRVFYVAASRAKRRLFFYRPTVSDRGELRAPSPYEDMIRKHLDYVPTLISRKRGAIEVKPDKVLDRRAILLGAR